MHATLNHVAVILDISAVLCFRPAQNLSIKLCASAFVFLFGTNIMSHSAARISCVKCRKVLKNKREECIKCANCAVPFHQSCVVKITDTSLIGHCPRCVVALTNTSPVFTHTSSESSLTITFSSLPSLLTSATVPNPHTDDIPDKPNTDTQPHRKRSASSPPTTAFRPLKTFCPLSSSRPIISSTMMDENNPLLHNPNTPEHIKDLYKALSVPLSKLQNSISGVETQISQLDSKVTDSAAATAANTQAIVELRTEFNSARSLVDPCEIRFTNIPRVAGLEFSTISRALLQAINCTECIPLIIGTREWLPAERRSAENDSIDTLSSFVIKFSSPTVRDHVKNHLSALKGKSCASLLGVQSNKPIYGNIVLPPQLYPLWREALKTAKIRKHARPIFKNLTIFYKVDRNSAPFPISSPADLEKIISSEQAMVA